ncbi:hypothetical protein ACFWHQ_29535 [Streptomyces sp. NPDC060334]|uniref:hypothetical protein n=1 Tax=Streptomyces sp. NPDC060334 TaxID=3347099 RepID=UPI003669F786
MGNSTARAALVRRHASADRDRLIADASSGLVKKGRRSKEEPQEQEEGRPGRAGRSTAQGARRGHGEPVSPPGTAKGQVEEVIL